MGRVNGGQARQKVGVKTEGLPNAGEGEEQKQGRKNATEIKMKRAKFLHRGGGRQGTGQRREPAADDVRFVCERNGWLPSGLVSGTSVAVPI